jgi:hypothetical protein
MLIDDVDLWIETAIPCGLILADPPAHHRSATGGQSRERVGQLTFALAF